MFKNLALLIVLSWVSFSYAKHPVVRDNMNQAESFKVEKSVEEQDAQRSVAGEKIKKKKNQKKEQWGKEAPTSDFDSEVRYWQYSE